MSPNSTAAPNDLIEGSQAFIVKVFSHELHTEEEDEVREVRLGNIENENEVMVRSKSFGPHLPVYFLHDLVSKHRVSNLFVQDLLLEA